MTKFRFAVLFVSYCLGLLLVSVRTVGAQRFLRDGFTSKLDEEFKYEAGLDNANSPSGMPREMFVLADLDLELLPPKDVGGSSITSGLSSTWNIPQNPALTRHLRKYLNQPLKLQLDQRKGGIGYRAFGVAETRTMFPPWKSGRKRLRGSWRRAEVPQKLLNKDFLTVSYDEAVRSRLMYLEIEMVLPRLPKRAAAAAAAALQKQAAKNKSSSSAQGQQQTQTQQSPPTMTTTSTKRKVPVGAPRVVYQLAVEGGVMNPKAILPRGDCAVRVYYNTGDESSNASMNETVCPPLTTKIGMRMKPGLVDPNWARGRTILRQGRSAGVI